jgi:hypothetical protein
VLAKEWELATQLELALKLETGTVTVMATQSEKVTVTV